MAKSETGFTLLEVIVSLGIFSALGLLAISYSGLSLERASYSDDREALVLVLMRARALSLSNICLGDCSDGKPHGVKISSYGFVLFQGDSYANRDESLDSMFFFSDDTMVSKDSEIVFTQLTGTTTGTTLILTRGSESKTLSVSNTGAISYE